MGESDVKMESEEELQEPFSSSSNKIDLSLDEIIKLNKKEQKVNHTAYKAKTKRAANRNNIMKKLNQVAQQQRGRSRGAQHQGPGRTRGLRRQRGTLPRGGSLNRANAMSTGEFDQTKVTAKGAFRGRGRGLIRGALATRGQRGGRPFTLDRRFASIQRAEKLLKYQTITSRRTAPSGTMLTVSLENATSAPVAEKTSYLAKGGTVFRGRSSGGAGTSSPKGIQLQFNYKATTNQTSVYLNDRFSGLRFRGRGRGRGGERGAIQGGGRGNVVGEARGPGRENIGRGGRGRGSRRGGDGLSRGARGFTRGRGGDGLTRGGRGFTRGRGSEGLTRGGRGFTRGRGGEGLTRGGRGFTRGRGGEGLTRGGQGFTRGRGGEGRTRGGRGFTRGRGGEGLTRGGRGFTRGRRGDGLTRGGRGFTRGRGGLRGAGRTVTLEGF